MAAGVDAFHVSGGVIDRLVTGMVNSADDGDALNVGAAAAVKQVVDVPVIAVGRIHDPQRAEQILAEGRADFIAMGPPDARRRRPAEQGRLRSRRPCSQVHLVRKLHRRHGTAILGRLRGQPPRRQGARVGRTARVPPEKVVVIGSGPAGMEAARVSAERGHHVTMFERNNQTGGALLWASILHPENEPFLRWLRDEIGRSSVKVQLGHEVSADEVADLQPDAVIVANGGQVVVPTIPGDALPHVQTGQALRERFGGWRQRLVRPKAVRMASKAWMPLGHHVVIVGADLVALELAEFLAARGRLVTVLEADKTIAPELGNKRKTEHMDRLDRLGVAVHVRAPVDKVVPDGVAFTPYGGTSRRLAADSVVIAGTLQPNTELYEKLVAALPNTAVHAASDCTGLGLIRKATEDGAHAACAI